MTKTHDGMHVVVTGGTSGIGAGIARAFRPPAPGCWSPA